MHTNRFSLALIADTFPFLAALAAGACVWFALTYHSQPLIWLSLLLALVALTSAGRMLQKRLTRPAVRLSRAGVWRLIGFAGIVFVLALSATCIQLAYARAYDLVHPGHTPVKQSPDAMVIAGLKTVEFQTPDDLTLQGWYAPTHNGATVILLHGHGGTRMGMVPDAQLLAEHGYGVLLYDTRSCGESDGTLSTFGYYEWQDVQGALTFLSKQTKVNPERIGVLGHSAGAATALLATERLPQIKAIVAESAFTSLEDNVASGVPKLTGLPAWPFAPMVMFFGQQISGIDISQVSPINQIAQISPRPILLVHGAQGETISVDNAYSLYKAAQEPKELYIIEQAGHGLLPQVGGETYIERVVGFFDKYLK